MPFQKFIFVFLLLVFGTGKNAHCQDPNYFVLGEQELGNTEIYSILQTQKEELYVTTNNGLYEYKHGKMQIIHKAKNQKGNALFSLIENSKNDVLCYNLSGQVFKITDGKLELYFEIPEKYLTSRIYMTFDKNDQLIVVSNGCFAISKGKIEEIYNNPINQAYSLHNLPGDRILLTTHSAMDSILFIEDKKVKYQALAPHKYKESYRRQLIVLNNKLIRIKDETGVFKPINDSKSFDVIKTNKVDIFIQFPNQEIWIKKAASGISIVRLENDTFVLKETFFKNLFISKVARGKNGLLFFGTFGQGLLVVPNKNIKNHPLGEWGNNLRGIAVSDDDIFLTDRKNGILHYKKTAHLIENISDAYFERIFTSPYENHEYNKKFPSLFYDKPPIGGSLKDVFVVDTNLILFSTSFGLIKMGEQSLVKGLRWEPFKTSGDFFNLIGITERCYSVVYDQKDAIIYLATISKLLQIDDENSNNELKFQENSISANDLLFFNDKLWCATQNHGILVFENGKLVQQLNELNGLGNNTVNKIEEKNNTLFISHKTGFQIYHIPTKNWNTIGTAEGIINGSVKDFAVSNDKIWFISNNHLLSLTLDKHLNSTTPDINISMDSIVVSDRIIEPNKNREFSYKQNHFKFYIDFKGIQYEREAIIAYRIKGFDQKWAETPSITNMIEYKYLPVGDYELEVEARYRSYTSKPIRYSFTIKKPYWQRWWFYIIIGLSTVVIIAAIIKNIKQKNKQALEKQTLKSDLINIELKALRSQMNPHFIFNSLNSIQDLILQEDTDASYDYIVLFSNLVRNILNYSNHQHITLEKEIEFLETYLQLETLRFGDDFHYVIKYQKNQEVNIPSLIIQPFVENALVHGLFHKKGIKNLEIIFELTDHLKCIIIDNGIGRMQSKKIQKRQGGNSSSFALEAIKKRLSFLEDQYGKNIGYTITDLYQNDAPHGTKIELILPLIN